MKAWKCKCGNTRVMEVSDGLWTRTWFDWDEEKEAYVEIDSDTDGDGEVYYECAECGERIDDSELSKYKMLVKS